MTEEAQVLPAGLYRYRAEPQFVRWQGDTSRWYVLGAESQLLTGNPIQVHRFNDGQAVPVEILEVVADRRVLKRDGTRVRYVLCAFDWLTEGS